MDWSRISAKEAIELARVIDRLPRPGECLKLAAEKAGGLRKLLSAVTYNPCATGSFTHLIRRDPFRSWTVRRNGRPCPVCPPLDQRSRDHFAAPIGNSEHVQRDDLDGGVK